MINEVLICAECRDDVDKMYKFHEMCMQNKQTLMTYFSHINLSLRSHVDVQIKQEKSDGDERKSEYRFAARSKA